ncbi:Serine/threonine-protein kinase Tel1 [[Candida] zeylanoides]
MALTIESVCTGLVSSRIRDRNESLLALEEILVPFPKGMPAKQAAALLSSLFRSIEIEKVFYLKATTTAVESRLSRACSGISTIIQSSIDPTNKVELKYKHYLSVLNEIVNLLIVSTTRTLLWPCAFAFLHIFSTVIRQRLVKNHFGTIEWRRVFVFVTKVIQALQAKQTVNGTAGYEDNLLGESMSCLCTLLDADTPSSTVYLPLLLPSDKLYFALLPILGQAVNDIKKEGAVAVALMKVINKLIVVLSTEDIHFVNKLVIMGVRLLLQFATTKLTTLQYQVLIFLNLNGVHDYMFWDDVPDPSVSDSDRDRDISIRSESDTEDHIGENRKNIVMERSILQYNIETLISTLMSMENQPFYQLKPRDVGMHAEQPRHTIDPSWFVLRTIHLASHDEGTEMSWMLISGLTRLAGTYYRFMSAQNNRSTSVTPEPSRHHKRQKLDSFQKALVGSSDTVDMVCKLLEFAAIADARRLALKLLAFHLQQRNWTSITGDRPEDGKNSSSVFNKDESSTSLFASDSGSNISYDSPWSGTPHTHSRIAVARMVLSTFDTTNVNVWVLLAIKSILEDQAVLSGALTHTLYSQLLRLIIPLVSHPTNELVVNLSTDLVHQIVVDLGVRVNKVVDSTLIVQLDNLVSMSEVSGPALVNVWSFHFWYAVHKVINYTNLSKKDDVQERVQKWLISKCDQISSSLLTSAIYNLVEYSRFTLFTPYAMASIASLVCVNIDNGKRTPKEIFKSLKVEMVSLWWSHNHSIEGFPFELFGYSDLRSMIDVDYKELTSVALSSSFPDEALVDQIARVKRTDVNSVVADSFVELLYGLSQSTAIDVNYVCVLDSVECQPQDCVPDTATEVLQLVVAKLKDKSSPKGLAKFLQFMKSDAGYSQCQVNGSFKQIIYLLAKVFSFETDVLNVMSLQPDIVIDMYGQLGENADASIEAILGVLIWKYDLKSPDLHQNLDFKEWYLKFQTYILPIDFHMCVLLHENVNLTVPIYSLTELLEADSSLGSTYDMQAEWVKNLFMALTVALARFTSVAPLLSALAVNVPSLTTKVLPNLICLYIELSVEDGVATTSRLMHWLIDQELSESLAALVIDIILCIREGAKSNKTGFKEVYSTLNIRQAFRFAASSKFEAASLMLLEDATCLLEEDERKQCLQEETKILQSVYESININDLIYGLPMEPSLDYAMNILEHNSSNLKSIRFDSSAYDTTITLSSTLGQHSARLIQSLMANGHVGMAKSIGDSVQSEELSMAFEWAWKLGTWDVPIPATVENESIILYKTLKQIRDYPSQLGEICAESCLSILSTKEQESHWLRALASTASVHSIFSSYNRGSLTTDVQRFENKTHWFEENHDSEAAENILQSRRAAFQILQSHHGKADNIGEQIWLNAMSELARYNHTSEGSEQNLQKRLNSTMLLSRISDSRFSTAATSLRESVKIASQFQSACTLWSQGETTISVAILKELRVELQKHGCDEMQSDLKGQRCLQVSSSIVNALLVKWMSESRQELPATIMSYYIVPTVKELSPSDSTASEVFKIFARFCEKQFTSSSFNEKLAKVNSSIESRKAEILQLKTHFHRKAVNPVEKVNIQKYYSKLKAQYNLDLQELETLAQSKSELSERAVEFYLLSISANYISSRVDAGVNEDHYNEDVDKFFALWLEFSAMESLNKKIRQNMLSLPNHLLVGWCPQLISRITSEQTEFQKSLHLLILQVCESHPFHSLYNLFSLTRHESSSKLNPTSTIAARAIWSQLKSNSKVGPTLVDVEKFCDESIILAETKTSATKGRSFFLDKYRGTKTDFAWWLSNLPHLPPPTLNLRIDLSMSYKDVPRFEHIEPKIDIAASGLSLPKIATFHLSDGSVHKVLFKHGSDDLRQDSIMEQVFEKVNQMFCKDKETRNRELTVRTYRAIPLGPQNGLIEFIPNSIALIDVIRPYHTLLDKMKLETAREKMKKCQSSAKANRIETYDDISRKIKPVMRHWFLDHFITPESWFRSKTMYTRGIASSSIVGYILGLGDRHCNNVLLDKVTGEPIHIDLGVAFDQGKMLPIPETVPFRLTRDIVDGFGITGVEGIFRKSCEHSYRVMKQNKDHVMAILDVLRWDPLYSWSLSPLRKVRLQEDDQTSGEVVIAPLRPHEDGSEAGRAISRVSDKLNGGGLSIEATVRELIQDATSKENLAVIYCGWCPFF